MHKILPFTIFFTALLAVLLALPDGPAAPSMADMIMLPSARIKTSSGLGDFFRVSGSGSGVAVACRRVNNGYEIYVLTAAHVVAAPDEFVLDNLTVQFFIDGFGGEVVEAEVLASDEDWDVALIRAVFSSPQAIAPIASEESRLGLLTDVYVVGCKLGMIPSPTEGVLSGRNFEEGVLEYVWGTSANSIYGNSGGGVFIADTGELIGVMSRVALMRGLPIAHMAYFVPLPILRRFLVDTGYKWILGD